MIMELLLEGEGSNVEGPIPCLLFHVTGIVTLSAALNWETDKSFKFCYLDPNNCMSGVVMKQADAPL